MSWNTAGIKKLWIGKPFMKLDHVFKLSKLTKNKAQAKL